MSNVKPLRSEHPQSLDDLSDLYQDVKSLSDHELQMTIGAVKPPKVPYRSIHPVIAQFPQLGDEEYGKLYADIEKNGQRKAVCMYQGMIWDGRARYDACLHLGLVPKVWALRRGDPAIYLMRRHADRFGRPQTPERRAAIDLLQKLDSVGWKAEAQRRRAEWIAAARTEFQRAWRSPEPCQVCGLSREYSHAHHSLPLNLQYDLGVDEPLQDHDWLCPVHHRMMHHSIAAELVGSRREAGMDFAYRYDKQETRERALEATRVLMSKAWALFSEIGGVAPAGNWSMLSP